MAGKRDDYILRAIEQLRQFVAAAVKQRESGRLDQALLAIVSAQEKLFARPAPAFMGLSLDEQIALLRLGESPASARDKCLGYAEILREAGLVFEARDRSDLAAGAFQSALSITLTVALESKASADSLLAPIADLMARLPAEQLQPPVIEMLDQIAKLTGGSPA